jgi:protection-of-telomeres protein 1
MSRRNRECRFSDLLPGSFYDVIGSIVKIWDEQGSRVSIYLTDYSENPFFYDYQDNDKFEGPRGKQTLQVTAWDSLGAELKASYSPGNVVQLVNVQMKMNGSGILEGSFREDRKYTEKVRIYRLKSEDHRVSRLFSHSPATTQTTPQFGPRASLSAAAAPQLTFATQETSGQLPQPIATKTLLAITPQDLANTSIVSQKTENREISQEQAQQRTLQVVFDRRGVSRSRIGDILDMKHSISTPDKQEAPLAFQTISYRATIRVVDFHPECVDDFCHAIDDSWEWMFALQVQDARAPSKKMVIHVDNEQGELLLGSKANE